MKRKIIARKACTTLFVISCLGSLYVSLGIALTLITEGWSALVGYGLLVWVGILIFGVIISSIGEKFND